MKKPKIPFVCLVVSLLLIVVGCSEERGSPTNPQDKKAPTVPPPPCEDILTDYSYEGPDSTIVPVDFTLTRVGQTYHMFHINGPWWNVPPRAARNFGHAITMDFENWVQQSDLELRYFGVDDGVDDTGWSSEHIWAPHIYETGGVFYMYYTGVEYSDLGREDDASVPVSEYEQHHEAIGLAKSNDMINWEFHDSDGLNTGKLFDPAGVPWLTWGDSVPYSNDCRDPFVWERWGGPGQLGMILSAKLFPERAMSIVFLTSVGPESEWYWQWPIDITTTTEPGHGAESACLVVHDGVTYLFWTEVCHFQDHFVDNNFINLRVATAPTAIFDRDSFTEIQVDNIFGYANEVTVSSVGDVIFSAVEIGGDVIKFGVFDFDTNSIVPLNFCGL